MRCVSCGNELTENAKFCIVCGAPVRTIRPTGACPVCGGEVPPGTKYCIYCGTAVSDRGRPTGPQSPQGQYCIGCGGVLYPGQKFCMICGTPASAGPVFMTEPEDEDGTVLSPEPGVPEHRLVLTNLRQPELQYSAPIRDSVTIGRAGTDIVIRDDREVSRLHCRITLSGDRLYLTDEGSRNGTIYCSQKIPAGKQVPLQSGEVLRIGKHSYSVELT